MECNQARWRSTFGLATSAKGKVPAVPLAEPEDVATTLLKLHEEMLVDELSRLAKEGFSMWRRLVNVCGPRPMVTLVYVVAYRWGPGASRLAVSLQVQPFLQECVDVKSGGQPSDGKET